MQSSAPKKFSFKFWLGLTGAAFSAFGLYCVVLAYSPDKELYFEREVLSASDRPALNQAVWAVINWKKWFFSMEDVQMVDINGNAYAMRDQVLAKGALIRFSVNPKKGMKKKFQMMAHVLEYEPEKKIRLRIIQDSTGRLTTLFAPLEWTVEMLPTDHPEHTLIRGTARARTNHWRSRVFGTLSERIVMNQVFYPDLLKLAHLNRPLPPNPRPVHEQ